MHRQILTTFHNVITISNRWRNTVQNGADEKFVTLNYEATFDPFLTKYLIFLTYNLESTFFNLTKEFPFFLAYVPLDKFEDLGYEFAPFHQTYCARTFF